jgi:hypothetical protein
MSCAAVLKLMEGWFDSTNPRAGRNLIERVGPLQVGSTNVDGTSFARI